MHRKVFAFTFKDIDNSLINMFICDDMSDV